MANRDDIETVSVILATLVGSPVISRILKDWQTLAKELQVPIDVVDVIRLDFLCGLKDPDKILNTILLNWRSRCGSKANITTFIKIVEEKCNWIGIGDQIVRNLKEVQTYDYTSSTKWKTLKMSQRADMLSKVVVMLGRKGPLIEIAKQIPICDLSKILEECLNGELLVSFAQSSVFELVCIPTLPKFPFYLERQLMTTNVLDTTVFSFASNDIFVIEGIDRPTFQLMIPFQPFDISGNQLTSLTCRFILLEHPDNFQRICNLTNITTHYIRFQMGYFIHVKTHGNLANIEKCLGKSQICISEDNFVSCNLLTHCSEMILLTGVSGAGKSTFLSSVAYKLQQLHKDRHIIYIDIYKFLQTFKNYQECTGENFLNSVAKYLSLNKLGYQILLEIIKNKNCLIELFLDGLDDLNLHMTQHVNHILVYIKENFKNIRVVTTGNLSSNEHTQLNFGQLQLEFVELTQSELTHLQCMYWSHFKNIPFSEHLQKYSTNILNLLFQNSSDDQPQVVGNPMMATILAKIYEDYVTEWVLNCNKFIHLNTTYASISMILQNFINKKLGTSANLRNTIIEMALEHLSCRTVSADLHEIEVGYKINEGDLLASEIIQRGQPHNRVHFVHQTFVSFIIGNYLTDMMCSFDDENGNYKKVTQQISNLLQTVNVNNKINFSYLSFCKVFNSILLESSMLQNRILLLFVTKYLGQIQNARNILMACVNSRLHGIFCLVMHGLPETKVLDAIEISSFDLVKLLDVASQHIGIGLVPRVHNSFFLFSKADIRDMDLGIHEPLGIKWTPIHFAAQKGNLKLFQYLLNSYKGLDLPQFLVHATIHNSKNDLAHILEMKVKIIKHFAQEKLKSLYLEEENEFLSVPILLKNINVELLSSLIENGASLFAKDSNGNNLAHKMSEYLSPNEYHSVVEILLNRGAGGLFFQYNNNHQTAIEFALSTLKIRPESIKLLLKSKEIVLGDDQRLVHLLIRFGYDSSVLNTAIRYLCNKQLSTPGDRTTTHLHVASFWQNVDAVKYFLQLGVNVNIRDEYGMTPLHIACTDKSFYCCQDNRSYEVLSILLEHGADVTLLDNNGREAMSYLLDHTCQSGN